MADGEVTIQVTPGVKVNVVEVDSLEGDRQFVAEAPKGLKIAIQQVDAGTVKAAANKVTMCG
jgi:hypothetical protein